MAGRADEAARVAPEDGKLLFEHVTLTYIGRLGPALNDVSFKVPAGKHFGVCGRTGAGKSSLLNAVFGLVRPESGKITVGGVELTCSLGRCAPYLVSFQFHERISYERI